MIQTPIFRRGAFSRPTQPGITLAGHPSLRQGLVFATACTEGGGNGTWDLVSNRRGSFIGTSLPSWRGGYMDVATGSGTYGIDFGAAMPLVNNLAQGAFTFWAIVRPDSAFSTSGGLCRRNDGNTVNAGWEILCNTGGTCLTIERTTTDLDAKTTAALTTNKVQQIAVVYPGDLLAANVKIFYDGVLQTINTAADGTGTQGDDSGQNFVLANANFTHQLVSSGGWFGQLHAAAIWKRQLSKNEILLLKNEPYALFRSQQYGALPLYPLGAAYQVAASVAAAPAVSASPFVFLGASVTLAAAAALTGDKKSVYQNSASVGASPTLTIAETVRHMPRTISREYTSVTFAASQNAVITAGQFQNAQVTTGGKQNISIT